MRSRMSSMSSRITWAARRRWRARSDSGSWAQNGWTCATSSTMPWTWSGRIVGTAPTSSPVAGLWDSRTSCGAATAMRPDYGPGRPRRAAPGGPALGHAPGVGPRATHESRGQQLPEPLGHRLVHDERVGRGLRREVDRAHADDQLGAADRSRGADDRSPGRVVADEPRELEFRRIQAAPLQQGPQAADVATSRVAQPHARPRPELVG